MNKILLVPSGGLANRMRAIASGLSLAKHTNSRLTVLWQKDKGLYADFTDIFKSEDLPFNLKKFPSLIYNFLYEVPRKKNLYIPSIINFLQGNKRIYQIPSRNDFLKMAESDLKDFVKRKHDVMIMSGLEFYGYDPDIMKDLFKPTSTIIKRAKAIIGEKQPELAVQIRRTDNRQSILKSPLRLFEESINKEIEKNPNVRIFLATDDEEIKNSLSLRFPERIIFNRCKARRDTLNGITDALAEMIIMAKCKKIYGSYYSSFSEVASQLYGNELIVVKEI